MWRLTLILFLLLIFCGYLEFCSYQNKENNPPVSTLETVQLSNLESELIFLKAQLQELALCCSKSQNEIIDSIQNTNTVDDIDIKGPKTL